MAEERKNWIVKVIDWGFKEIWPLLLVYPFVQIVFQGISIYLIGWPTWSEAGLNTLAQPLKISGIVNGILTLILVILGLSVAARRLLQFNQQLKQQNKQINIQLASMFYDAVKRLDSDEYYIKLGALTAIRKTCTEKDSPFFEESHAILKSFIENNAKNNSKSPNQNIRKENQSKTVESALVTLTKILNKHDQQISKNNRIEEFKNIDFTGLDPEAHLFFKSLRFSGCRLINCIFTHATFDNVRFLAGSQDANASDLTGTKFFGVKFTNCCFGDANISDVDFGEAKGLTEKNLVKCRYHPYDPPKNITKEVSDYLTLDKQTKHVHLATPYDFDMEIVQEGEPARHLTRSETVDFYKQHPNLRPRYSDGIPIRLIAPDAPDNPIVD